jgi:hypothetical protein
MGALTCPNLDLQDVSPGDPAWRMDDERLADRGALWIQGLLDHEETTVPPPGQPGAVRLCLVLQGQAGPPAHSHPWP